MRLARIEIAGETFQAEVLDGGYLIEEQGRRREVGLHEAKLLPPAAPSKILAVGWNFPEHIKEMAGRLPGERDTKPPEEPNIFFKPPSCLVAHGEAIVYPGEGAEVHYEAELAAVVGRRLRRAAPEECRAAVAGWTCANDVTERQMQRRDKQWWRAKGYDTFGPLGPWLETEEPDPEAHIRSYLNGELRQQGQVRDMLWDPFRLLSYISRAMTLLPGDVVMLGTPPGVGELHPGDVVRVEVEGVGALENSVRAE